MFLLVVLLLALITALALGRDLGSFAALEFRRPWLALGAIATQVLIISVFPGRFHWLHIPLHLGSYVAGIAFVWVNRSVPGVVPIGIGGFMNFMVIALNGGVMPASRAALRIAGVVERPGEFANSTHIAEPRLAFLGDVFALPEAVPLISNVFSIGDLVIGAGAILFVFGVCQKRVQPGSTAPVPLPDPDGTGA